MAAAAVVALCVLIVLGVRFFKISPRPAGVDARVAARSAGDPAAPLRIVEHIDFQCQSCSYAALLLRDTMKSHPSLIRLEVKFHPLKAHPHGLRSALYAECAARQEKFWGFYYKLFEKQAEWSTLETIEGTFHEYARALGLDQRALDSCLGDPETEKAVLDEKAAADALGVDVTPTFFMNGKMVVGPKGLVQELQAHLGGYSTRFVEKVDK